jgi:hypothetical protein
MNRTALEMDPTVAGDYTPPELATTVAEAPSAPAASAPPPFAAEPASAAGDGGKAQENPLASAPPPMASAPVASAMAPPPPPMAGVVPQKPVYEMFWDCRNCSTKKLLGKTHRHCPVCGVPQKAADRYFPKDREKVAVHDHLYFGSDTVCSRCETQNCAAAQHCFHCGFSLGTASQVALKPSELSSSSQPPGRRWNQRQGLDPVNASSSRSGDRSSSANCPEITRNLHTDEGKAKVAAAVCLLVVFLLWFFLRTEDAYATVTTQTWQTSQEIEELRTVHESCWSPTPSGAYNEHCETRQHGTEEVPDGEDCEQVCSESCTNNDNGDGTYSQDCSTSCGNGEPPADSAPELFEASAGLCCAGFASLANGSA